MPMTQPANEEWNRIAANLADPAEVVALVRDLDGPARREVARNLPGALKAVVDEKWGPDHEEVAAFRAAGAATLGGSAAVASWLSRRPFNSRWSDHDDTAVLLDLWEGRDEAWLADLARRLTLRLREPRCIGHGLVFRLLAETGIDLPEHDPLVVAWVLNGPPRSGDPLLPALLPRIFDVDGAGAPMADNSYWLPALAALAESGEVDPAMLRDGCVRRFLRGGTAAGLRAFVDMYRLLEPDDPDARARETGRHVRDHVRLVPVAPGPVAGLSARLLRELPGLEPAHVTEALDAMLARPELRLVREGLAWLDEAVRRSPDLAGPCAAALARAFGHPSPTVQRRAARIALALPAAAPPEEIRAAVSLLPRDVAADVAARFGGEVEHDDPAPPLLAAPPDPPPGPYPTLATPAKVAAAIAELQWSWDGIESILEALVRLHHHDRHALRAALVREHLNDTSIPCYRQSPNHWLRAIACVLVDGAPQEGEPLGGWDFTPADGAAPSALELFLRDRCEEILIAALEDTLPPMLLATPTCSTGHLAPMVLVERLEAHEAAGMAPGYADFQQAVLRLPQEVDAAAVRRAAALISPAGRGAASWLARGGPPAPEVEVTVPEHGGPSATVQARETGLPHVDAVFRGPDGSHGQYVPFWVETLPSHPEVADAYLLPHLRDAHWTVSESAAQLRGDGLFGEAVARTLAGDLGVRANGLAAGWLRALAARGDLPAADLGRWTAKLVRSGDVKLIRSVEELEELASLGAYPQVWTVIAAALPGLCPAPGERAPFGLARLIALGTRTARWSSAHGAIPEIERLAAQKGKSDLHGEARTLHEHLTARPATTPPT